MTYDAIWYGTVVDYIINWYRPAIPKTILSIPAIPKTVATVSGQILNG
jgi:hypothetical protein